MKYLLLAAFLTAAPTASIAQHTGQTHQPGMASGSHDQTTKSEAPAFPTEAGQGAFAAIQEIAGILDADKTTDWSKVDLEGLRRHLVDMDNVALRARVTSTPTDTGMRFKVMGEGEVRDSIVRMVTAHATAMNGVGGFTYDTEENADGVTLIASAGTPEDLVKLRGLGFFGVMTLDVHHQAHHMAIARGSGPHQ